MADDELEYEDLYFEEGDNYFYIDDGYALADELAESSVPDPGIDDYPDDWDDLTRFEYFNDVEYDSDGFHDDRARAASQALHIRRTKETAHRSTRKRKRVESPTVRSVRLPPVLFRLTAPEERVPEAELSKLKTCAILPDWREKFKDIKGMADVISSTTNNAPAEDISPDDLDLDEEIDEMTALSLSLQDKLAHMGLDVTLVNQSKLLLLAQKMMAQDEDAEELLTEIIEEIHSGHEDAERDPFSEWVANNVEPEQEEADVEAADTSEGEDSLIGMTTVAHPPAQLNGSSRGKRKHHSPETTPPRRKQARRMP